MNYISLIEELKKRGSIPGLDAIQGLLEELGHPEDDLKIVHVMQRKAPDRESIEYFIVCQKYNGKIKIMEEEKCDEIKFFELQNLPKNIISYIKKGIEYYLDEKPFSIYGW